MPDRPDVPDDQFRPTQYTPEIGTEFCSRMAAGTCLTRLCKKHKDMPTWKTLQRWLREEPEFKTAFDIAREALYDYWADETIEIADTPEEGETTKSGPSGVEVTTADMLGHRRLRIDARKWLLSKLTHRYGDRVTTELTGTIGVKRNADELTDSELAAIASRGRAASAQSPEGED